MANAQKPTQQMRHMELKYFVILQWTDDEFIDFMKTPTKNIHTKSLSKATDIIKFYEHMNVPMGKQKPQYTNTELTRIIHYICTGDDFQYSPSHNFLFDLITNSHGYVSIKNILDSSSLEKLHQS